MTSKKTLALAGIASLLLVTACSVPTPTQQAGNTKPGTGTATGSAGVGGAASPAGGTGLFVSEIPGALNINASSGARIEYARSSPSYTDGVGAFRTFCYYSHMAADDPLVAPGRPGGSHLHTFFGNTGVDANSTADSIRYSGDSTCTGGTANRSGYWVPSILDSSTGTPVIPDYVITYYKSGYTGVQPGETNMMPEGLRMIAGNAKATGPSNLPGWLRPLSWSCAYDSAGNGTSYTTSMQQCEPGQWVKMIVSFPQCWDGINLDSADHMSHMAYSDNGCPASHPVAMPQVTYNVYWPVPDSGNSTWRLSSDMYDGPAGYSGHGDWWNGWDPAVMQVWFDNCVHAGMDCSVELLGNGMALA